MHSMSTAEREERRLAYMTREERREEFRRSPLHRRCERCDGAGVFGCYQTGPDDYRYYEDCQECHGDGYAAITCVICDAVKSAATASDWEQDGKYHLCQVCKRDDDDPAELGPSLTRTQPIPAITMAELVHEESEGVRMLRKIVIDGLALTAVRP